MSKGPRKKDPPIEPMPGSKMWLETGPDSIKNDLDTVTLVVRLQLALNALAVQVETVHRINAIPEGSAERMRTLIGTLLTFAAYVKEATNILTGTKQAPGEFQRVLALARIHRVSPQVVKKVRRICSGAHPACALLGKMRNELGFHWDPAVVRAAVADFATNESVIWVESGNNETAVVHRLATDVASHALFSVAADSSLSPEQESALARKRITQGMNNLDDASDAILYLFNDAVLGYLHTIGAQHRKRNE